MSRVLGDGHNHPDTGKQQVEAVTNRRRGLIVRFADHTASETGSGSSACAHRSKCGRNNVVKLQHYGWQVQLLFWCSLALHTLREVRRMPNGFRLSKTEVSADGAERARLGEMNSRSQRTEGTSRPLRQDY